jgi:putative transposase
MVHLAPASDGHTVRGEVVDTVRQTMPTWRAARQQQGPRSATRHRKRLGQQEQRFRRTTNPVIAQQRGAKATQSHRGIALALEARWKPSGTFAHVPLAR